MHPSYLNLKESKLYILIAVSLESLIFKLTIIVKDFVKNFISLRKQSKILIFRTVTLGHL